MATSANGSRIAHLAASEATERFIQILKDVRSKTSSPAHSFDLQRVQSWTEVRRLAGLDALKQDEERAKGFKGLLPRVGRMMGKMQPALEPIATTLPCGDYTALVSGSIVFLFKAFDRVHKVREKVIDTLGEYPQLLDTAEQLLSVFSDPKLEEKAIDLYIALLEAIEGIITWLQEASWKHTKVIAQQGLYARALEEKMDKLARCSTALREQANICDMQRTFEIYDAIHTLSSTTEQGFAALGAQISSEHQNASDQLTSFEASVQTQFKASTTSFDGHFAKLNDQISKLMAQSDLKAELEKAKLNLQRQEANVQQLQQQLAFGQLSSAPLSCDYVISLLDAGASTCPPNSPTRSRTIAIKSIGRGCTGRILSTPKFRTWLTSSYSQKLVVAHAQTFTSSPAASALHQNLSEVPGSISLSHDCLASKQLGMEPVITLLSDLLLQMLRSMPYDLREWTSVTSLQDHYQLLQYKDLGYLCSFFKYLVRRAPYGAIFCILDAVRWLERGSSLDSVFAICDMFDNLMQSCNQQHASVFKLILFDPEKRGEMLARAEKDELIRISEDIDLDDEAMTAKQLQHRLLVAQAKASRNVAG